MPVVKRAVFCAFLLSGCSGPTAVVQEAVPELFVAMPDVVATCAPQAFRCRIVRVKFDELERAQPKSTLRFNLFDDRSMDVEATMAGTTGALLSDYKEFWGVIKGAQYSAVTLVFKRPRMNGTIRNPTEFPRNSYYAISPIDQSDLHVIHEYDPRNAMPAR